MTPYPHPTPPPASSPSVLLTPQFRNPKASLRVRLCDLLGHLQHSGERHCQEFYRALYLHARPLHGRLPSRHALRECQPGPCGRRRSVRGLGRRRVPVSLRPVRLFGPSALCLCLRALWERPARGGGPSEPLGPGWGRCREGPWFLWPPHR